jgi:hypothetical protein
VYAASFAFSASISTMAHCKATHRDTKKRQMRAANRAFVARPRVTRFSRLTSLSSAQSHSRNYSSRIDSAYHGRVAYLRTVGLCFVAVDLGGTDGHLRRLSQADYRLGFSRSRSKDVSPSTRGGETARALPVSQILSGQYAQRGARLTLSLCELCPLRKSPRSQSNPTP